MSDYSIVPNAALTATADAIRTKSGSQATIEFDHNTGFADAIEEIPSGGGEWSIIGSCSYTLAKSGVSSMEIPVSYSGTPKCCVVTAENGASTGTWYFLYILDTKTISHNVLDYVYVCRYGTGTTMIASITSAYAPELTETTLTLHPSTASSQRVQAQKYLWYIYG